MKAFYAKKGLIFTAAVVVILVCSLVAAYIFALQQVASAADVESTAEPVTVSNETDLRSQFMNAETGTVIALGDNITWTRSTVLSLTRSNITLTLDLNGKTLTASDTTGLIQISGSGSILNIVDSSEDNSGKISGRSMCIDIRAGTVNLFSGSIVPNSAGTSSIGVQVYGSSAVFNMKGGMITGHTSNHAGGVYVSNSGTFNMEDGTISQNVSTLDGGGVYVNSGKFIMEGGTISDNEAQHNGGGVYVASGSFTMNGGSILSNTAAVSYHNLYVASGATFAMNGGIIGEAPVEEHQHELTKVEMQPSTCVTAGHQQYWYCRVCNTYFSDEGTTEINIDEWLAGEGAIAKVDHTYGKNGICVVCGDLTKALDDSKKNANGVLQNLEDKIEELKQRRDSGELGEGELAHLTELEQARSNLQDALAQLDDKLDDGTALEVSDAMYDLNEAADEATKLLHANVGDSTGSDSADDEPRVELAIYIALLVGQAIFILCAIVIICKLAKRSKSNA